MSFSPQTLKLFGLDLTAGVSAFQRLWADAQRGPLLAWVAAEGAVRLLKADGVVEVWVGDRRATGAAPALVPQFMAVELPESVLLRRPMTVPSMPGPQVAEAVALEMQSVSPFPVADLVWGWRSVSATRSSLQIEAVLASRQHVQPFVMAAADKLATQSVALEVWAFSRALAKSPVPIVLQGFAESLRATDLVRRRRRVLGVVALTAGLLLAIALTPTLQLWLRAREAEAVFASAQQRVAGLVRQREALLQSAEGTKALADQLSQAADPLRVLQMLTVALPDDTYLQTLQVTGAKVAASGLTGDSAALMTRLGTTAGFKDVKASQPAMRQAGAAKESFGIEFVLDSQALAPLLAQAPGSTPAVVVPAAPPPLTLAVPPPAPAPLPTPVPPSAPIASTPTSPPVAAPEGGSSSASPPVLSPFSIGGRTSTPPTPAPAAAAPVP